MGIQFTAPEASDVSDAQMAAPQEPPPGAPFTGLDVRGAASTAGAEAAPRSRLLAPATQASRDAALGSLAQYRIVPPQQTTTRPLGRLSSNQLRELIALATGVLTDRMYAERHPQHGRWTTSSRGYMEVG